MTSDTGAPTRNGLSILWDVIVAPRSAFSALRERPYVGWAFGITCLLGVAGALLQIPAGEHVAVATFASNSTHDPRIAALSPAELQRMVAVTKSVQQWIWLFYPVIVAIGLLIAAICLTVFNALGRGDGTFRKSLALAANVGLLTFGINYFLVGVLTQIRGGDAFNTSLDLVLLMPSVAWLAPGAPVKVATFLSSLNIFSIWSFVLLALGQQTVSRLAPAWAWAGAAVITFGSALVGSAFVR